MICINVESPHSTKATLLPHRNYCITASLSWSSKPVSSDRSTCLACKGHNQIVQHLYTFWHDVHKTWHHMVQNAAHILSDRSCLAVTCVLAIVASSSQPLGMHVAHMSLLLSTWLATTGNGDDHEYCGTLLIAVQESFLLPAAMSCSAVLLPAQLTVRSALVTVAKCGTSSIAGQYI
jgi:hypothetical protein